MQKPPVCVEGSNQYLPILKVPPHITYYLSTYLGEKELLLSIASKVPASGCSGKWRAGQNIYDIWTLPDGYFEAADIFLKTSSIKHKDDGNGVLSGLPMRARELMG